MGLFQKRLQLVPQPYVIARQLVLSPRHRSPQTLFGIGHKAQSQFPGHQPLHQTFGIWEVLLASPRPAVRLRLGQMQRSRPPAGAFPFLAYRFPVPFQCFPNWFPVLCRRFHDYFFDLLLEQPCGERSQLVGAAAKKPPFKLVLTIDFDVRHDHSQHLLVDIDSRYPV